MQHFSFLSYLLALITLLPTLTQALPSEFDSLFVRDTSENEVSLVRRGGSRDHNPKKEGEAKKAGHLDWKELQCECKVSEQHIPVLGNQGWHFDLRVKGFGDSGDKANDCGQGILDNLHGECHTKIDIRQWYCAKEGGPWGRHISWDSSKFFHHSGVEMALWRASYEQMGGCKCDFNWGGSIAGSVFSGLAMAVPIPVATAAKAVVGGAMTVAKAVGNVAKSAATNMVKGAVKDQANQRINRGK